MALAVSGGADSMAMAVLAAELDLPVVLWHVDHGLGPEASHYVEVVVDLGHRLGVPVEVRRIELSSGSALEERAREARYEALPDDVCVAHTADDRAETILFNMFRGAGMAGVAAPFGRVHRPLISLRRSETRAVCEHFDLEAVDDPMNSDERFTRVAVRRRLIPLAEEIFDRDPVPLLNRHADAVADALTVVQSAAEQLDPTDVAALGQAPTAVATEALRIWIKQQSGSAHFVDSASIDRVMTVVRGEVIAAEVVGGHRVARTAGRLRVETAGTASEDDGRVGG